MRHRRRFDYSIYVHRLSLGQDIEEVQTLLITRECNFLLLLIIIGRLFKPSSQRRRSVLQYLTYLLT